jgi:hypothetical protein
MQRILIGFFFVYSGAAGAAQSLDFTIHQEYTSTRALGMGNAFIAVVDDHSSLFYNPAAMARREDGVVRMFLRGGIDSGYLDLFDEIEAAQAKPTEAEQVDAMTDLVESHYGDHFYFRMPTIGATWVRKNWGIAFVPADLSVDIAVHQQIGPMLNVNAYLDSTLAYGYARDVKGVGKNSRLSLGATVKAIHRVNVSEAISAGELASDTDVLDTSSANEGLTIDADIGVLYTPRVKTRAIVKPTFAFVARNILDYGFTTNFHFIDKNTGEPPKLQRRFDFGTKLDLPNFWKFEPKVAADIKDVGHKNWTWVKGSHIGAELYWKMYNWWKGHWAFGLNQGYWTAGLGARMAIFQLDIATFGEEVGTTDAKKESRRYMLEMSLDF